VPQTEEVKPAPHSEVVVPPTVSSYTYSFEEDTGKEATYVISLLNAVTVQERFEINSCVSQYQQHGVMVTCWSWSLKLLCVRPG